MLLAMLIDQINLNQLRVFESVYRTRSMTQAARELHLTQSGVSQHIKALEDVLELKLFDRIKQKLVPTQTAKELYKHTAKSFEDIETILNKLKKTDKVLTGTVSLGLPIEFGNNIVLPLIQEFQKKHPRVKFKIRQGFPFEMNHLLLNGELDFAFVDSFALDKGINTEPVYDEVLELCISKKYELPKDAAEGTNEFYEKVSYVDYQEEQSVLSMWMKQHTNLRSTDLDVRVFVMNAQAVGKLIQLGAGAGVIPTHLAKKINRDQEVIRIIKGSNKPLVNAISIACLEEKTLSPAAQAALSFLKETIKSHSN